MTITLAFKKDYSNTLSSKIFGRLVKHYTKSEYFHVEMILDKVWVSSNSDVGGVSINEVLPLSSKYDYYDLEIDGRKLKSAKKFIEAQIGKKYDWTGIFFSQILKDNIDDRGKWFCSEIVTEILMKLGRSFDKNSNQYSPGDLYKDLAKELSVSSEYKALKN